MTVAASNSLQERPAAAGVEIQREFLGLDGLRGAAAVVIVFFHAEPLFGFQPGSGYLAVDLFFGLSGFVLAHAYDRRFALRMRPAEFMRIRFIRLYPLYFLGLSLAAAGIIAALVAFGHANWTFRALALAVLLAVFFLPTPPGIAPRESIYPLNTPSWSLAFELLVNLAFALAWRRLTLPGLILITSIGGFALIGSALHYGALSAGSDWVNVLGGLPRVFFSFPLGVLLLRLYRDHGLRIRIGPIIPLLAMLVLLTLRPPAGLRELYDLACVLVAFPLIIVAAATDQPQRFAGAYTAFGAISYAIYATHFPILEIFVAALTKMTHGRLAALQPWSGIAFLGLAVGAAALANACYDEAARKWLRGRFPPIGGRSATR